MYKKQDNICISTKMLACLRKLYPKGTVYGVDDIGSLLVHWDNGSTLHVLYGIDVCKILK